MWRRRSRRRLFFFTAVGGGATSSSGWSSARRRTGNVDHGHPLFFVVPAVEAFDAGNFDVVRAEEARHVNGSGLVGLPDLRRSFFFLVERLDSDDLALLVVIEIRARL